MTLLLAFALVFVQATQAPHADPPALHEPAFAEAFEAAVEARLDHADPAPALAAARALLPEHARRRERLAADLDLVESLRLAELRGLRSDVQQASSQYARPASASAELNERGEQTLAEAAHPGLLSRWLQRRAVRFGEGHDWTLAIDQSAFAVALAEQHLDEFDQAWALSLHLRVRRQNVLQRFDDWRPSMARDLDAIQERWPRLGEPGLADWFELYRCRFELSTSERLAGLQRLRALGDDARRSLGVRMAALGMLTLELVVMKDWEGARRLAERLDAWLDTPPAAHLRFFAHLGLGTWHRNRLQWDGESVDDQAALALRELHAAVDAAMSGYEHAWALEWAVSLYIQQERYDIAAKAIDECLAIAEATSPIMRIRMLLHEAWVDLAQGDTAACLKTLDLHDRLLKGNTSIEQMNPENLRTFGQSLLMRARALATQGALLEAFARLVELTMVEDQTIRNSTAGYEIFTAAEACETHGYIIDLLAQMALGEVLDVTNAAAFAQQCMEHARARLLLRDLAGGDDRGLARMLDASDTAILDWGLPALPEGTVELRWFIAWPMIRAPDEDGPRYVLLARRGQEVRFDSLGDRDALDARVDGFLARWFSEEGLELPAATYQAEAADLARTILGPALPWLEGDDLRVLAMPDGQLERLPLGALVLSELENPPTGYAALDYFVRRAEILTVPSLAILEALPEPLVAGPALGLFVESSVDGTLRSVGAERRSLLDTHDDSLALSDEQAGAARLRAELADGSWSLLHIASHAESEEGDDPGARLVLGDGGRLGHREVQTLPLPRGARVVLSACGTASGEFHLGEGVLGIWRAFLLAGASSVVATLTDVEDSSAAAFMSAFHRHASTGRPLAAALRAASLEWLAGDVRPTFARGAIVPDAAHPFLWAPWVCVGKDGGVVP